MKSIDLGEGLSILANVGVLAGLLLLVLELQQTNDSIRGATYQAHATSVEEWDKFIAGSEVIVDTIVRYQQTEFSELPPDDQVRLLSLCFAGFNRLQNLHRQYELGLLDDVYYDNMFRAELEINVPRWKDAGFLASNFYQTGARDTFKTEVEKYLDAPLIK